MAMRTAGGKIHPIQAPLPRRASGGFRAPAAAGLERFDPAGTALGEMVAVADQGLMPLASEQGKAVGVDVVSEPVAGEADAAAAAGHQALRSQVGPGRGRGSGHGGNGKYVCTSVFLGWPPAPRFRSR